MDVVYPRSRTWQNNSPMMPPESGHVTRISRTADLCLPRPVSVAMPSTFWCGPQGNLVGAGPRRSGQLCNGLLGLNVWNGTMAAQNANVSQGGLRKCWSQPPVGGCDQHFRYRS